MNWVDWIQEHAHSAHWLLFGGALLAGFNIPISIDLLMILGATLAATLVPEHTFHLYFALLFGCILSAWISYWIGRAVGPALLKRSFFSKLFSPQRVEKMKVFLKKRGAFALILGRFIPFGVRNCLFMSSGMSKMSFPRFAFFEALACCLWSGLSFSLYYLLGKNIDLLYTRVKMVNALIFIAFSVTVIGIIWYKKRKPTKEGNV